MPKFVNFKKGLLSVLFWSIISAAFIGPGTVTTASKAGASFQLSLMWALVFSTIATIVLQEAAARITIASGKSLGEIISIKYQGSKSNSIRLFVFLAVAFGCAAYQAGNMLGAVAGLKLISSLSTGVLTVGVGLIAGALLWIGNYRMIANLLGMVVAIMGLSFIVASFNSGVNVSALLQSLVVPSIPKGSSLLIIGLIGTTIVPYNLFLASGISRGQSVREMRYGLITAILIGGLISMAILIVGIQVVGEFSFENLAEALSSNIAPWASGLFGFGLFAAGMTSSITSPLAAAVTAQSIFGKGEKNWSTRSKNFRLVWGSILLIGLFFGLTNIKPIPAIILAQAINGALLPIITIFLMLVVNDGAILPKRYLNSVFSNVVMLILVGLSCFLGINNVLKALGNVIPGFFGSLVIAGAGSFLIVVWLAWRVFLKMEKPSE